MIKFTNFLSFCMVALSFATQAEARVVSKQEIIEKATFNCSLGRLGEAYVVDGVTWQDIYIEGPTFRITGSIPGSPMASMMNASLVSSSTYEGTYYSIETQSSEDQKPSKTYAEFIKPYETLGTWKEVQWNDKRVSFVAEVQYTTDQGETGITRIFATKKKLYLYKLCGKDVHLAQDFLSSFTLERE